VSKDEFDRRRKRTAVIPTRMQTDRQTNIIYVKHCIRYIAYFTKKTFIILKRGLSLGVCLSVSDCFSVGHKRVQNRISRYIDTVWETDWHGAQVTMY